MSTPIYEVEAQSHGAFPLYHRYRGPHAAELAENRFEAYREDGRFTWARITRREGEWGADAQQATVIGEEGTIRIAGGAK